MFFATSLITLLTSLVAAAPAPGADAGLVERQGGFYVAVGNKYDQGGCRPEDIVNSPDPIFGNGNICQPLDRFGTGADIVSYNLTFLSSSCSGVQLFLTPDCTGTSFTAELNKCVQGSTPFVSAFVTCDIYVL